MKTFPTLYKRTSTGAIQNWRISVDGNKIITKYGQLDGKQQSTEDVIKEGKNIGKANETTPAEQALSEAESKWEGKIKKGYVEDVDRAEGGEKDIDGGYDCILAHKFKDHSHKIKYPAYVQPKLNGHRCLAIIEDGKCTLWSRTRKPITSMPHIVKELEGVYTRGSYKLDGELYNHSYKDNFEALASLIRQEVPADNCTDVEYHVYDQNVDEGFGERIQQLRDKLHCYEKAKGLLKYIVKVDTVLVNNEDDLLNAFTAYRKLGYEGAMARNEDGLYVGKRSYDLQKIKEFYDAEFKITGIEEGRGKLTGHVGAFICLTEDGKQFKAKMRGDQDRLRDFFECHSLWKGKILTVKYQNMSSDGIPIFPVGERFKEDL
jgi:DNA ligase-1